MTAVYTPLSAYITNAAVKGFYGGDDGAAVGLREDEGVASEGKQSRNELILEKACSARKGTWGFQLHYIAIALSGTRQHVFREEIEDTARLLT